MRLFPLKFFFSLVTLSFIVGNLFAGTTKSNQIINTKLYTLEAETLLRGLRHPWCLAFLPDGTFLITEREGNLILVDNSMRIKKNISLNSIPIHARGQGGLFDIAIDQNFDKNNFVYISYNGQSENDDWGTELVRAKFLNNKLSDKTVLFKMQPKSRSNHHFGGRIVLNKQDELFLTLGDGAILTGAGCSVGATEPDNHGVGGRDANRPGIPIAVAGSCLPGHVWMARHKGSAANAIRA